MANPTSIKWANVEALEEEVNTRFRNNPDFDPKNLVILAEVSEYGLVPVESAIDEDGYFHIMNDPAIIGLRLYMGSRRQFIHERYTIEEDTIKIVLSKRFRTAWNERKFVVFRNGYLVNNGNLAFAMPTFSNNYLKKVLYSTVEFVKGDVVDVYYIESGEDFDPVPISRDVYIGAIKYQATRSNERIILIPYPNDHYSRDEHSFFIFNENGEYLDNRTDYIVSADGKYVTLSEENALRRARVDYVIFAFPQLPTDSGVMEGFDSDEITDLNSGDALFRYAFSVENEKGDPNGLVRFAPLFSDYRLTKKNLLLFGGGTFISPQRYEVYTNDAILFTNDADRVASVSTRYTMVIFDDTTNHEDYWVPGEYTMTILTVEEEGQTVFKVPTLDDRYRSMLVFRATLLLDSNDYSYDDDKRELTITNPDRRLEVGRSFYVVWFNALINNTNRERLVLQFSFDCNPQAQRGTALPSDLLYQELNEDYLLLFLNGRLLRHSEYEIVDGRVYLNERLVLDENDNLVSLAGHRFFAVYLESLYTGMVAPIDEEEARSYKKSWQQMDEDDNGGAIFRHYESLEWSEKREAGVVRFYPEFPSYRLAKKHMILFGNGIFIHPDRYDLYDNGTVVFNNDLDRKHAQWSKYDMLVLDDEEADERYAPSSMLVRRVVATEEKQATFEIPDVGYRYRSFLLFKGSLLMNRSFRYRIEDDGRHVTMLNDYDYVEEGNGLTFVFLDAFARGKQEVQFMEFFFRCDPRGTTKLPANLLHEDFNPEEMAVFLNGRYLDASQFTIKNGYLYLDGYLLKGDFDHYVFTIVYLITMVTALKEYDHVLPQKPAFPVRPVDDVGNAYFEFSHSEDREAKGKGVGTGGIVKFEPEFTGYSMVKSNLLLFGNGTWISPDRFELYDNDTVVFTNAFDKQHAYTSHYTMAIFNDQAKRSVGYAPTYFEVVKVVIDDENQRTIPIPYMNPDFKSFIAFRGSLLMGIANSHRYKVDFDRGVIEVLHKEDYLEKGRTVSFVFLNAATMANYRTIFLQETFKLEKEGGTLVPSSVYNERSFTEKHLLLFLNGAYLNSESYEIRDNHLYLDGEYVDEENDQWISAVHIVSLRAEDYDEELTEETRAPEGDTDGFMLSYSFSMLDDEEDTGLVSFMPIFTDYELSKRNVLLFSRGLWIHPNRYELYTNSILHFFDKEDQHAASMPITMAILNEATKDEGYRPVAFTIRPVLATQEGQRLFIIPREFNSTFIVFLGSLLLPISNPDRVFIDEEKGTLFLMDEGDAVAKGRALYFVFVNEDSSLNDRRYPAFLEETFDAVSDPRVGTPLPSDWYTEEAFDERFLMLFVGGRFIPTNYYEIRDHRIYPEIDLDDIETEDVIKKYQCTAVYLASYVKEGVVDVTHPWDPKPDEGRDYKAFDDLPKSDVTPISGLVFDVRTSDLPPIEGKDGRGWVQFLDRYEGYTLAKENFLLFGNSMWIDPIRYDVVDNGTIVFREVEDQKHADWAHYTMAIFSNMDAIREYGDHYVKTEWKVVRVKATEEGQGEFELPTVSDEWASWITFRNGLIVPITDESRFYWDDYNHKFRVLEEKEKLKEGDELVFVYLKATSNSDQEVAWTQVSFKCEGYMTNLPETVILYQNQRYDKRRVLLFLNGTHVNNDRFAIKDNKVYLKEGAYLGDDTHLYTLVYLTTANSEEEDTTERNVVDETYEEGLDDIVFEERYAYPVLAGKVEEVVEGPRGPNHLAFEKGFFAAISFKGVRGLIRFEPTFKGYVLQHEHFLLFSNGYFVDPTRYELYDQNKVLMNNDEDKDESPYNDYTIYILGDSDSYTNGFTPAKWNVVSETVKGGRRSRFDIPVTDHEESRSLIAYRGSQILTGYKLDWDAGELVLNDLTDPFEEGEAIHFVFLESNKTKGGKYPYLYQESFPASTSGSTRLPDRLREVETTKHMLYLDGRLLKLTEYLIEDGQILLAIDAEDQQLTIVTLYERDDNEQGIVRR